jgi:hypothetical protein
MGETRHNALYESTSPKSIFAVGTIMLIPNMIKNNA